MALPDRTLCWVEGPPWDRTCDPVSEVLDAPLDVDALRRRLHDLDTTEMGRVIGVMLGVLVARGINLNTFLPDMVMTVLEDEDIAEGLRALGER